VSKAVGVARITILWIVIFVASSAGAWYFGLDRASTVDLTKKVSPFVGTDVQEVTFTSGGTAIRFARADDGKFARDGLVPTTVPTPAPLLPGAPTPLVPTVMISPGARIESFANQLHDLPVDRVVSETPSESAEYGLDMPVLLITVTAKAGGLATFAIGAKGVGDSTYYVRRNTRDKNDTVLVSRYTIDEIVKFAKDQLSLP
jgi:hypothetical protein